MRILGFALLAAIPVWAFDSGRSALYFEPNQGQAGPEVRFIARVRGATVPVQDSAIILDSDLELRIESTNPESHWQASAKVRGTTQYYLSRNRPLSDIPHFGRLVRKDIYPGIDLVLYGAEGRLEYDFVLRPGADPKQIRLHFSEQAHLTIAPGGDLTIASPAGKSIVQRKPVFYQQNDDGSRKPIDGQYALPGRNRVAFIPGRYDPTRIMTIDPVIESATLLGGKGDERLFGADARTAIVGSTTSPDFPGALVASHRGLDVFIYLPSSDSTIIIGGSGDDIVTSVSAPVGLGGPPGSLIIGGYTNSRDFPTTKPVNAFNSGGQFSAPQPEYGGGDWDGFVLFTSNAYVYLSTYIGGSGDDRVLAVSYNGNSYNPIAVAGSTTSDDFPVIRPWQASRGGGMDGFAATLGASGDLIFSTYLGGAGDDRALAIANASPTDLYVGGESRSSDWQPQGWTGARNGPSDGFVAGFKQAASLIHYTNAAGLWLGGSGEDRVTALTQMADGKLAIAGVTSSTDFAPGGKALSYSGGASDVFFLEMTGDLQTTAIATMFGGSGEEEPLAIASNRFNEVLIAGWTNSANFPLFDPFQPTFAGGGSDGFLYYVDSAGQPIYSTYYGGSGADRITSVALEDGQRTYFGGTTDSPDLPLKNASQAAAPLASDGFFGVISSPSIHASGLTVGKDLTGLGFARLGDTQNYIGVPLTVTSGDATRVLLAIRPDDGGQVSITVSSRSGSDLAGRDFRVYCLTDNGTVPLTLTAPGYAARSVNVNCAPSALFVNWPNTVAGRVTVVPAVIDSKSGGALQIQLPRGGVSIRVGATASDPALVQLQQTAITIDGYSNVNSQAGDYNAVALYYGQQGVGDGEITLTSASGLPFMPSNRVRIHTGPTLSLNVPAVARGFAVMIIPQFTPALTDETVPVTFTSSDASKLVFGRIGVALQGSITTDYRKSGNALVYGLLLDDTGTVSLSASAPGYDPITMPVRTGPLGAYFIKNDGTPIASIGLAPNDSVTVGVSLYVVVPGAPSSPPPFLLLAPDAQPLRFSVSSSQPPVASVSSPPFIILPQQSRAGTTATVKATAAGTSTISVQFEPPYMLARQVQLRVDVQGKQISMGSITLGKDLQQSLSILLGGPVPFPAPVSVTVTSADPSRLLLSADGKTPGQASLTFTTSYSNVSVWAQGLADSGDVSISAKADGYGPASATVHLAPSGFAWSKNSIALRRSGTEGVNISAFALDPANLAPILAQAPRFGLDGVVTMQNSNPAVAGAPDLPFSSFRDYFVSADVKVTAVDRGDALIGIVQPPGFVSPVNQTLLKVKVSGASLRLSLPDLGTNLQGSTGFDVFDANPSDAAPQVTLSSGDPSRLLISTSSSDVGAASVAVRRQATGYPPVYLQALGGTADVKVTAAAPGFEDASSVLQIFPTAIAFTGYSSAVGNQAIRTDTQQDSVSLDISAIALTAQCCVYADSSPGGRTLRPGLDPIAIQVNSSNPAVAAAKNNPVRMNPLTSNTRVLVTPIAPGDTEITLTPPAGFVTPPPGLGRTAKISVAGPAFALPELILGKDLQAQIQLSVQTGAQSVPNDVDVVLSSGDGSLALLSADGKSPGASSITVHFAARQPGSRSIFVQGLAGSGQTQIQMSAAGYATTMANVTLTPTTFLFDQGSSYLNLGATPTTVRIRPAPISGNTSFYSSTVYQFRPGLADVTVAISAADPRIVTVQPPRIVFPAGASEASFTIQAIAAGATTIALSPPGDYVAPPELGVQAQGANLILSSSAIGKDLQDILGISGETFSREAVSVTVTSSDPTRLLISASPSTPGQASLTVANRAGQPPSVYLQALAGTGSVKVTVAAPGYQNAQTDVFLLQSAVQLSVPPIGALTPLSGPITFTAQLFPYSASSFNTSRPQSLRPGAAPATVQVNLTDPKVGSVTPGQILFSPGDASRTFLFQPLAAGSALLSLSVPNGFADPLSLRQQLLNVLPARVAFNSALTVGKDLQKAFALTLPAVTASALAVRLTSSDPARLLLSGPNGDTPAAALTVTFSAGTTTSNSFNMVGLSSTGTVALNVSALPLEAAGYNVVLQPSGFRFTSGSSFVNAGSSSVLQIVSSELIPQTLFPAGDYPLRPGIPPVAVGATSSDPSVVNLGRGSVFFNSGDARQSLPFTAGSRGTATVGIIQPPGFAAPSAGAILMITVQ